MRFEGSEVSKVFPPASLATNGIAYFVRSAEVKDELILPFQRLVAKLAGELQQEVNTI